MPALALAVRQRRELGPTMWMLASQYPYVSVGKRLERAAAQIDKGVHWCDALRSVGLLTWTDVGLLKSAERVGNLAWALEEMSDSACDIWRYPAARGVEHRLALGHIGSGRYRVCNRRGTFSPADLDDPGAVMNEQTQSFNRNRVLVCGCGRRRGRMVGSATHIPAAARCLWRRA